MNRLLRCLAPALLLAVLLPAALRAASYPPHPDPFVNDFAGLLDGGAEARLRADLQALKAATGVEATLLTLPSWKARADAGESLETYTTGLFNAWGIGAAGRDDGILVLVAPEDRDMRLELGRGYDAGYDLLAQNIVGGWFLPAFRKGDYQAGILAGMAEIEARIARPHAAGLPPAAPSKTLMDRAFPWIFGAFAAIIVGGSLFGRLAGDWSFRFRRCPHCGQRGMHREHVLPQATTAGPASEGVSAPATGMPVTGMIVTRCLHCSYREDRPWRADTGRNTDRGGGGFGGGRSSGGGASGHW